MQKSASIYLFKSPTYFTAHIYDQLSWKWQGEVVIKISSDVSGLVLHELIRTKVCIVWLERPSEKNPAHKSTLA